MHALTALCALMVGQPPADPNSHFAPEAFKTLVNPNCSHCVDEAKRREKELRPDDRVLCWTRGKYDGGAIPIRFFLNPYRVISDTYGTFVYDPDAGFARAFPASLDYSFHGWRNGIMVMKHKDGTLFSCLSGRAFDGPRKDEQLPFWPTIVADWGWVMKQYPNGVAYHMYEKYQPIEIAAKANADSIKTRRKADPRLPAEDLVLGIDRSHTRSNHVCFPVSQLERAGKFACVPYSFECGNPAVVFCQASTRTATAYVPEAQQRKSTAKLGVEGEVKASRRDLKLEADGKSESAPFIDRVTGTRFDITGRGIEGELKGWTLAPLPSVMCKWFAWAVEYPTTRIYQEPR